MTTVVMSNEKSRLKFSLNKVTLDLDIYIIQYPSYIENMNMFTLQYWISRKKEIQEFFFYLQEIRQ